MKLKDFYLVDCLCKDGSDVWKEKAIVKANDAPEAWMKFKKRWEKEVKKGIAEFKMTVINDYSIEKFCPETEIIL